MALESMWIVCATTNWETHYQHYNLWMLFALQHPSVHNRLVSQAHVSCLMPEAFGFPYRQSSEFGVAQPTSVQCIMSSTSSAVSLSPKIVNKLRYSVALVKQFSLTFGSWMRMAECVPEVSIDSPSHVSLPSVEREYR